MTRVDCRSFLGRRGSGKRYKAIGSLGLWTSFTVFPHHILILWNIYTYPKTQTNLFSCFLPKQKTPNTPQQHQTKITIPSRLSPKPLMPQCAANSAPQTWSCGDFSSFTASGSATMGFAETAGSGGRLGRLAWRREISTGSPGVVSWGKRKKQKVVKMVPEGSSFGKTDMFQEMFQVFEGEVQGN